MNGRDVTLIHLSFPPGLRKGYPHPLCPVSELRHYIFGCHGSGPRDHLFVWLTSLVPCSKQHFAQITCCIINSANATKHTAPQDDRWIGIPWLPTSLFWGLYEACGAGELIHFLPHLLSFSPLARCAMHHHGISSFVTFPYLMCYPSSLLAIPCYGKDYAILVHGNDIMLFHSMRRILCTCTLHPQLLSKLFLLPVGCIY